MSAPIDFRINFNGIAEAAAAWRTYQGALGTVIASENQTAQAQARTGAGLASLRAEAQATAASFLSLAPAMQNAFQPLQSSGALTSGIRNVNAEFKATVATVKETGPPLANLNQQLTEVGSTSARMGSQVNESSRNMKALAFGFLGMTTAGAEAVGMLSMYADTQTMVAERTTVMNDLLAQGAEDTQEYRNAVNEVEKAERFANMTRRNLMLSMFDMIPFTVMTISQLKQMGFGMTSLTALSDKLSVAIKALGISMRTALISSGIGIAVVALGLLAAHFMNTAEAAETSSKKMDTTFTNLSSDMDALKDTSVGMTDVINSGFTEMASNIEEKTKATLASIVRLAEESGQAITDTMVKGLENEITVLEAKITALKTQTRAGPEERGRTGRFAGFTPNPNAPLVTPEDQKSIDAYEEQIKGLRDTITGLKDDMVVTGQEISNVSLTIDQQTEAFTAMENSQKMAMAAAQEAAAAVKADVIAGDFEEARMKGQAFIDMLVFLHKITPAQGKTAMDILSDSIGNFQDKAKEALPDLGEWVKTMEQVIEVTSGAAADGIDPVIASLDKLHQDIQQGAAGAEQYHQGLISLAEGFGIDLPEGIELSNSQLLDILDTYKESGSAAEATAAAQTILKDALAETTKITMDQITAMDDLVDRFGGAVNATDAGRASFAEWFTQMRVSNQVTKVFNDEARRTAAEFGINIPAGMEVTQEQLQHLLTVYDQTKDPVKALNALYADQAKEQDKVSDTIMTVIDGMEELTNKFGGTATAVQAAREEFATWFTQMRVSSDTSKALTQELRIQAESFGIELPRGITLTNEELKKLIQTNYETGTSFLEIEKIIQQRLSPALERFEGIMSATSNKEFGKAWKELWDEDMLEGVPKKLRSSLKDIGQDMIEVNAKAEEATNTISALLMNAYADRQKGNKSGLKALIEDLEDMPGADKLDPVITWLEGIKDTSGDIRPEMMEAFTDSFLVLAEAMSPGSPGGALITKGERETLIATIGQDAEEAIGPVDAFVTSINGVTTSLEDLKNAKGDPGLFSGEIEGLTTDDNGEVQPTIIPAPVKAEDFDSTLEQAALDVDSLGRGGGDDEEGSFAAAVIPPPDATEFTEAMNTLLLVPADFVSRFNAAMGGGGGDEDDEGSSGLIIPAPASDEFVTGLNESIDLANAFVEDFNTGMEDIAAAAEDSIENIMNNMQDLESSVNDSIEVVNELQNALSKLKSKNITVHVGLEGPGVKFLATGFHGVVNQPTIMVVGEAGPERVDVSPSGGTPATGLMMDRSINVNPVMNTSARENLIGNNSSDDIRSILRRELRRGSVSRQEIVQRVMKHFTFPIQVKIGEKAIIDIVKEHLLDD